MFNVKLLWKEDKSGKTLLFVLRLRSSVRMRKRRKKIRKKFCDGSFQQRGAHLLCLCLNASENSHTCARVCFYSSCEFSALESTRPTAQIRMYRESTTCGEGHFDARGSQKPRASYERERKSTSIVYDDDGFYS